MTASLEPTAAQRARWTEATRAYVEWLEQTVAERTARIAELHDGPEDSNVLIRHYGLPDQLLGVNTAVTFRLRTANHPDGQIEVGHGLGVIEISTNGGPLHIEPRVSNTIRLWIGD